MLNIGIRSRVKIARQVGLLYEILPAQVSCLHYGLWLTLTLIICVPAATHLDYTDVPPRIQIMTHQATSMETGLTKRRLQRTPCCPYRAAATATVERQNRPLHQYP